MKLRAIAIGLVGGAITLGTTFAHAEPLDLKAKIDPLAQPLVDDGVVVGMVVGVLKDGQTQILSYGEKTKGQEGAPDGDTVYEIGSISKVFTGTILAEIIQESEKTDQPVKLDDPVLKYLPDSAAMPIFGDRAITLEDLATHTSGLPRMPNNMQPADRANPYADYTVSQMYAFLKYHKLRREPGTFEYSNLGMGLLGHLLARRQGKPYEEMMIERIAGPLGMNDTRITLSDDMLRRMAQPYDAGLTLNHVWDIPTFAGAGAIRSTVSDLLKFAAANMSDDKSALAGAMRLAQEKRRPIGGGQQIGLAWHIARDGKTRWHNGMTGGYSTWLSVLPERKTAVVLLSNTATSQTTELGEKIMQAALGMEVKPLPRHNAVEIDKETLESCVGTYYITPFFAITITLEDGKLMAQASRQQKYQLFPESKTKFFYRVVDAQITFTSGEDGKADCLVLHQNGVDMIGMTWKWPKAAEPLKPAEPASK